MNEHYLTCLVSEIQKQKLDAMLIAPSPDLVFLLDHMPLFCYRFQGLFITAAGDYFYVCNLLSADEMRAVLPNRKVYSWHDNDGFLDITRRALEDHGLIGKRIGVNKHVRAFNALKIQAAINVTFVAAEDLCDEVRIHKTEEELDCMQKAARIAEEAFRQAIAAIRPGMVEQDVASAFQRSALALGGEDPMAMIASGPNSGFAHYNGNSRQLEMGDALIVDFGCAYHGLRTDITRTVFLGVASPRQIEIYNCVRMANETAEAALLCGERWIPNVDAAARDIITNAGYGAYFTTRLGHGIGYMGHEAPDIKQNHHRSLESGMCFSIEPGIYIPGEFGIRIEDCAAIRPDCQAIIFTDGLPKDICIVDF